MTRRLLAAAFLVALALLLLVAAWPQLFHLESLPVIAQVVSLRGLSAAIALLGALILAIIAIASRRSRRFAGSMALLLVIFVAATAAVLGTRGFGGTAFESRRSGDITVLSWNTLGDAPGAAAIARLALDSHADIVTLPETTSQTATAVAKLMAAAGRPMQSFTRSYDLVSKAKSTSLLISKDLGTYSMDLKNGTTAVLPTIVARPSEGAGPAIVAVHAVAPVPGEMSRWRSDLDWLAGTCSGNTIMAGDFNTTLDQLETRASGTGTTFGACTDAALATDSAAVGTWPTPLPAFLGTQIDHVMATRGWRVSGMRVIQDRDGAGSDHRPVLAQLSPAS